MSKNQYLLRYMLSNASCLLDQVDDCMKFIPMLGDGAELLSDAFQALLKENKFGCVHDHACAIIWALCLDAHNCNYYHDECDVLRNGCLVEQLIAPMEESNVLSSLLDAVNSSFAPAQKMEGGEDDA